MEGHEAGGRHVPVVESVAEVAEVEGKSDLEAFVALPYELHRQDPMWVGPLRRDVRTLLSPRDNPFWEHAAARHFLARCDGRVVGRISAIDNRLHNEVHQESVGFFGFFECIDDEAVAARLFDAAAAWLRMRGLSVLRGPASPSMNDECGLLVDGFDTPPTLMQPHNPRYYQKLLESAHFQKAKDLLAYQPLQREMPDRLVQGAVLLQKRYGISVRPLDMKNFDRDVDVIKRLYNKAWEKNWGFVPMTDREIEHMARQFKPVVDPNLVLFAMQKGEPIGMTITLPDFNVALRANRSGKLFPGIVKVLWASRKIDRARILVLGTIPEWRGKGVDALLYKAVWENANKRGIFWGEGGWVLEDNPAMNNAMIRIGFGVYKTYRMYDRPL
jgi:GNAT superfamily N-acetyltransferase